MKKHISAIFVLLLFVMLLSPVRVSAFQPIEKFPQGIVVEITPCDIVEEKYDTYLVDVVVRKDELEYFRSTPFDWSTEPYMDSERLLDSEYANLDNEWISLLLYIGEDYINDKCGAFMFGHYYLQEDFGFTEFKVVIYEKGEEPVVSGIISTDFLASWENHTGHKIIYNHENGFFSLREYEIEYNDTDFTGILGFFNSLQFIVMVILFFIVGSFALFESFIYLISRQGKKAVLIAFIFNSLVVGLVVIQLGEFLVLTTEPVFRFVFMWVAASLYVSKVVLLDKYAYTTFKVSILFSSIFYVIFLMIQASLW